jgi:hypothetical protein
VGRVVGDSLRRSATMMRQGMIQVTAGVPFAFGRQCFRVAVCRHASRKGFHDKPVIKILLLFDTIVPV